MTWNKTKLQKREKETQEEKKPTTLLPHVKDSKPWLTWQLKSTKRSTGKEALENILFPDFSKSRSQVLAGVFYMIACSPHMSVTSRPNSLAPAFPQSRGDTSSPSGGSLSPHNYSSTLFPSGHSEWPTHWTSNLPWVHSENIPNSAQEQEQSFWFHPESSPPGNTQVMLLSEMNHQPPDKVLWTTLWGWHKIRKRKWLHQCETLFQPRRKRDTSVCTLNRRTSALRSNICHKQDSNPQHCSKRQLPSPSTHFRFWDTYLDLKWKKNRKKKKERKILMSLQYSTWRCSLRIFPSVHSVVE